MILKLSIAMVGFLCATLGPARANELKVDFSVATATPQVVGTPPYGLGSGPLDLEGSFTTHETSFSQGYEHFVGAIDSLDFKAGTRTYTASDLRVSGIPAVVFDDKGKVLRFALFLDTKLDDMVLYNENGSSLVLNGATENTIFCDSCVKITSQTGVSAVPLPASAAMFGMALLATATLAGTRRVLRA